MFPSLPEDEHRWTKSTKPSNSGHWESIKDKRPMMRKIYRMATQSTAPSENVPIVQLKNVFNEKHVKYRTFVTIFPVIIYNCKTKKFCKALPCILPAGYICMCRVLFPN
jgi:hypothetical protein